MNSHVTHTQKTREPNNTSKVVFFWSTNSNLVEPLGINILLLKGKYLNLSPYKKKQEALSLGTGTVFLDFWGLKFLYSNTNWCLAGKSFRKEKRWTGIKQTLYKLVMGCQPVLENDPSWHRVSCHVKGTPRQMLIQYSAWKKKNIKHSLDSKLNPFLSNSSDISSRFLCFYLTAWYYK